MSDGLTWLDSNRARFRLRGVSLVVAVLSCLGVCSTDSKLGGVYGRGGGELGVSKDLMATGGDEDRFGGTARMRFFVGVVVGDEALLELLSMGDEAGSPPAFVSLSRVRFRGRPRFRLGASTAILVLSEKMGRGRGLGAARLIWEELSLV